VENSIVTGEVAGIGAQSGRAVLSRAGGRCLSPYLSFKSYVYNCSFRVYDCWMCISYIYIYIYMKRKKKEVKRIGITGNCERLLD
jgi:hypothetical protein